MDLADAARMCNSGVTTNAAWNLEMLRNDQWRYHSKYLLILAIVARMFNCDAKTNAKRLANVVRIFNSDV